MLVDFSRYARSKPVFDTLAQRGIRIGCASHVLNATDSEHPHTIRMLHYERMHILRQYADVFSAIEFSYRLSDLSGWHIVRAVESIPIAPVWRVTIHNFDAEKYLFTKAEWGFFVDALQNTSPPGSLILSLARTVRFSDEALAELLQLVENLYPVSPALEFDHRSWAKAADVLRGNKVQLVERDTPELPGIIKHLHSTRSRSTILRVLGRERSLWLKDHPEERHAYTYSAPELQSVAERAADLMTGADSATIIFGNHPAESAVQNALCFATLLDRS
jgi:hypothetical protein